MSARLTRTDIRARQQKRSRTLLILGASALVAVGLNAVVAAIAVAAGAPADYGPLTPPAYTLFTLVGVVLGWVGWRIVQRRARDPRRTLTILVPLVVAVSLVPDLLLLALGFVPGTTPVAVAALMVMHVVVAAVAVPGYALATRQPTAAASGLDTVPPA